MRWTGWRGSYSVAVVLVLVAAGAAGAATWNVSTVTQLNNAVAGYASGDEIVIAPGTYNLTSRLIFSRNNVTIRGSTGNREQVGKIRALRWR